MPIDHWFKNEWADLFEEAFAPSSCLMKTGIIKKDSRDIAYAMVHDKVRVNGPTVYSFVILNKWLGAYLNGNNS